MPYTKAHIWETKRAEARRRRIDFFNYLSGKGIDIGCGMYKVSPNAIGYDRSFDNTRAEVYGDAAYMKEYPDESFDFVYSSHCLEHLDDIELGLQNWWRLVRRGGFMILYLPHRDHFEERRTLPSLHAPAHKHYFLPFHNDPPDTKSVYELLQDLEDAFIHRIDTCLEPYRNELEYSIEAIIEKGSYTPEWEVLHGTGPE